MIYIVTGYKRSGTSLMMHILKNIGIPLFYDKKHEKYMTEEYAGGNLNPYFYEHPRIMFNGLLNDDIPKVENHAVKVFLFGMDNLPKAEYCIIYMDRNRQDIFKSLRKYKSEEALKQDIFYHYPAAQKLMSEVKARPDTIVINFDELLACSESILELLRNFIGRDFNLKEISGLVKVKSTK